MTTTSRPPAVAVVERLLQFNVVLLVILGTSLLAMGQQNFVYAITAGLAALVAIYITDIKRYYTMGPDATTLAAIFACLVLVIQVVRNADESQLLNVANILIYLEIILLFQKKEDRTYWSLIALSLLQVIVAAALNLGLIFGLIMATYVISGFAAMMLFFILREMRPFLEDESNETSKHETEWVGLLPSESIRDVVNHRFVRRLIRMVFVTGLATILVFFSIPRFNNSAWQGANRKQITTVGFTEEVRLDDIGRILENPEQVMRVEFTDLLNQPYQVDGEPYFRGTVLSEYHGGGVWKQRRLRNPVPLRSQTSFDLASTVTQHTTLEPGSHSVLFNVAPSYSVSETPAQLVVDKGTRQVTISEEQSKSRGPYHYTIGTTAFRNGWQRDLIPSLISGSLISIYYPPINRPSTNGIVRNSPINDNNLPTVFSVAQETIEAANLQDATHFEKAKALENHFRHGRYTYSLDVNQNRNQQLDPIEDFVQNHRSGHCEYFAGALTCMLRSQGIPARMVVGYKGGEFNTVGDYYIVRQLHAHAWVEAYLTTDQIPDDELEGASATLLRNGATLRLDPTPDGVDVVLAKSSLPIVTTVREFVDYCQVLWGDYVLGLNSIRQQESIYWPIIRGVQSVGYYLFNTDLWRTRRIALQKRAAAFARQRFFGIPLLYLAVGGFVLSLLSIYRGRRWIRRGASQVWQRVRTPRESIGKSVPGFAIYRQLESILGESLGIQRTENQTPYEFARAAGQKLSHQPLTAEYADLPETIANAYYRARFGAQRLSRQERQELATRMKQLTNACQASLS